MKRTLVLCFVMSASLLFGQLDSNSVTVTASRNAILQPDQVAFGVHVTTGLNASLEDVLTAVKGSGITNANFSGVDGGAGLVVFPGFPAPAPSLQWFFQLDVPLSKMKDTVTSLISLQQSIQHANPGFTLSFAVQGTRVSAGLQQSHACSIRDLIGDANAQAQKLANAAGLTMGSILAMASTTSSAQGNNSDSVAAPDLFQSQSCVLTVKFALTRF